MTTPFSFEREKGRGKGGRLFERRGRKIRTREFSRSSTFRKNEIVKFQRTLRALSNVHVRFARPNSLPPPPLGPAATFLPFSILLTVLLCRGDSFLPSFLPAARKSKLNRWQTVREEDSRRRGRDADKILAHTSRESESGSFLLFLHPRLRFYETSSRFNFRGKGKGSEEFSIL